MGLTDFLRSLRVGLPRPKAFLAIIPLEIGTELISFVLLFNKLTGVYGLLAILTGYSLSVTQFSAYLYNLLILILLAFCIPHIRRETPLPNLALAWAYGIDTLINAAYTAVFATSWFFASSEKAAPPSTSPSAPSVVTSAVNEAASTIASTIAATATYMSTATPTISPREDEVASAVTRVVDAVASVASTAASAVSNSASEETEHATSAPGAGWMGGHETAASLTIIVIVTVIRFYFSFIVIAHTRQVLQRYGDNVVDLTTAYPDDSEEEADENDGHGQSGDEGKEPKTARGEDNINDEEAGLKPQSRGAHGRHHHRHKAYPQLSSTGSSSNNPFANGSPAGEGWQGRVGRALVSVGRGYWLGRQQDDAWARDVSAKFRSSSRGTASGANS